MNQQLKQGAVRMEKALRKNEQGPVANMIASLVTEVERLEKELAEAQAQIARLEEEVTYASWGEDL
jgi:phage shock protein A